MSFADGQRESQRPVEIISTVQHKDGVTRQHPAFGLISAHRVQGGQITLFGSPIKHSSTVRITISEAEEQLDLHHEWQHQKKMIAEVELSEAQWAAFVTRMNISSGVPCTLLCRHTDGFTHLPAIEDTSFVEKKLADIKRTTAEQLAGVQRLVKEFKDAAEQGAISKTRAKEIATKLDWMLQQMPDNTEFMAKSVTKHTEHAVTAAKAEVDAFILNRALQFPGLKSAAPEMPALEDKHSEMVEGNHLAGPAPSEEDVSME